MLACTECGQPAARWAGRCGACGAWGTVAERPSEAPARPGRPSVTVVSGGPELERRVPTGLAGVDRVLGGGLVPASVALLAGEPGIGKSTLLLHLMSRLADAGLPCLLASGEESHAQVAARARRLGIHTEGISYIPGRDLADVLAAAGAERPFLLAVDSVQTIRDPDASAMPGGPSQVRACSDALVGMAKAEGTCVLLTGHVTKDGDLAGPRTLEHAVDAVLTFEGDPRSGMRMLAGGKNRFGPEGEVAWFEMGARGLQEVDPGQHLAPGSAEPGAATALALAGRRAFAIEVQALAVAAEGPSRRQATGLDPRRFALVAAVVDRAVGIRLGRMDLFGASSGGVRVEDPACDLAVAAALVSAVTGTPIPAGTAFAGEVALTGEVRSVPGLPQRAAAARTAGVQTVVAAGRAGDLEGVRIEAVRHVREAFRWVANQSGRGRRTREQPAARAG